MSRRLDIGPHLRRAAFGAILAALSGSAHAAPVIDRLSQQKAGAPGLPDTALEPVTFEDMAGWADDDHAAAFATFLESCNAVVRRKPPVRPARPAIDAFKQVCRRALGFELSADPLATRHFFEANFRPWRISELGKTDGFLTGYYEPEVDGARERSDEYATPLRARPGDLVARQRVSRAGGFPNTGGAGLRKGRKLLPYHDRAAIEDGALDGRGLELVWLRDPIEAFFIHIQGSARIRLPDGGLMRLNYAAHNGHPYTPVGRILIDRGIVAREEMSLARIRAFIETNPAEGRELMRMNRSYVFFRNVEDLDPHQHALGAQGLPLTPGRSIAVDKALHIYGTPFWIDATLPLSGEGSADPFRRLMIGQDTGSAIVGPARADIYFGTGPEAGAIAGRIRHPGRFVMLVPLGIDPRETAGPVPLPPPRPSS